MQFICHNRLFPGEAPVFLLIWLDLKARVFRKNADGLTPFTEMNYERRQRKFMLGFFDKKYKADN